MRSKARERAHAGGGLWVFGYGSLMWRPGFDFLEARPATLYGYHRALCVYSWSWRGTRERPGLVCGLDRGGSCVGRAYLVASEKADKVRRYLYERELEHDTYRQRTCPVALADGRRVGALCHVVSRLSGQYTGKLAEARIVELVLQGRGRMGSSRDYLENTIRHLDQLGIRDGPLHRLMRLVQEAAPEPRAER